jgi:GxxExxY protein
LKLDTEKLNEEEIGKVILDSAFKVHTVPGPGLLESVYEAATEIEFKKRGMSVEKQVPVAVMYEGVQLEVGFRADLGIEQKALVELKSVQTISPLFKKITTHYLKLIPLKLGYLINVNESQLKDGIVRVVNGLEGKNFFGPSRSSSPSRDIPAFHASREP